MLARENFDDQYVWHNERTVPQDAQTGRSARPQRMKALNVPSGVRWGSERCENAAGGLFQHPARKHKSQSASPMVSRGNSGWLVLQPASLSNCRSPYGPCLSEVGVPPVFEESRNRRHRRTMKSGPINNTVRRPSSSVRREICSLSHHAMIRKPQAANHFG